MAKGIDFAPTVRGERGKRKVKKGEVKLPRKSKKAKRNERQKQRTAEIRRMLGQEDN